MSSYLNEKEKLAIAYKAEADRLDDELNSFLDDIEKLNSVTPNLIKLSRELTSAQTLTLQSMSRLFSEFNANELKERNKAAEKKNIHKKGPPPPPSTHPTTYIELSQQPTVTTPLLSLQTH